MRTTNPSLRLAIVAAVALLAGGRADATVTQVDGTILPAMTGAVCISNIQICLDNEEGVAGGIGAILDAAQVPEIFLPNTVGNVTFKDVAEGAGFENSFGYYNVGDDVSNPANLHPILGCGVPAAVHTGEAGGYVVNAEAPNTATVNFGTELAQGRYYGGFIAFYLITPEGRGSAPNCGDFAGNGVTSFFGRAYFTQRELNNDGDFVHHLVYTSEAFSQRFYFGFEDLFRGGDNDFEDMMIAVTGLTPPCAPSLEVCDGFDNDCDGLIDAADPGGVSGSGAACTCDGSAGLTCVGGNKQGLCTTGQTVCLAASIQCSSTVSAVTETCNSLDDNCNGTADDNPTGVGVSCDGVDLDQCNEGATTCSGGVLGCSDATATAVETCNGVDDDCDGSTDEGNPGGGVACDGADGDSCAEGTTSCAAGAIVCSDSTGTIADVCNGVDDDCDGSIDEGNPGGGTTCDGADGDLCKEGVTACTGGVVVCTDTTGNAVESCNGLDDDCDLAIDEGNPGGGVACDGTDGDLCAEGVTVCSGGAVSCNDATGTTVESCNGVDDDCDAVIDEGNPGGGVSCDGADGDLCKEGVTACSGGVVVCGDTSGNNLELCNGLDDDCDLTTDEGNPGGGAACDGTDGDLCAEGVTVCTAGALACNDATTTTLETCNGVDDDCDAAIDEGNPGGGVTCDGADSDLCKEGVTACSGGVVVCGDTSGNTVEICNGLDDDCDLSTDEGNPGGGAACDGTDGDLCQEGTIACTAGALTCSDATGNTVETCNGVDDDCDGAVDEGNPGGGATCDGSDADLCKEGSFSCAGGVLVCSDTSGNNLELCNGLDDDCDLTTDEGNPGGGAACDGTDADLCPEGVTSCTAGALVCSDSTGTNVELCNGLDDDCDGVIDDSPTNVGVACSVGVGTCARNGATVCTAGAPVCNVAPGAPGTELCNGLDDDCDGVIDDGFNVGGTCEGQGACGAGLLECATLSSTRCSTDPGGSGSQVSLETCNGLDDDCDGAVDEGLNDIGACGTDEGECSAGRLRCIAAAPVCVGAIGATPETCDGKDNDCDALTDEHTGDPGDVGGGLVDEGASCGEDDGECELGAQVCVFGVPTCQGGVGPASEACNGLDDDCDNIVDNDPDDVGAACGNTEEGECGLGATVCVSGALACNGEVGPTVEVCNLLDDDCNGLVDDGPLGVGAPCGSNLGVCTPGAFACTGGVLMCVGALGGSAEQCNGIDDDCDGAIDDNPAGVGQACGNFPPPCEPGTTFCISGGIQCVGGVIPTTEQCNAIDDDCDGNTDEGGLCSGATCVNGECAAPCGTGEFPCPQGKTCEAGLCVTDPCVGIICPPGSDGTAMACAGGVCVTSCSLAVCGSGQVCRPSDGLCVPDNCLFVPDKCAADEFCAGDGACVNDPCEGVTCPNADQFCRAGTCVQSCGGVDCGIGELCNEGACAPSGCPVDCDLPNVCNPGLGTCVGDPCRNVNCAPTEVCSPSSGACIPDACEGVVCPGDEVCRLGNCFDPPRPLTPDAGPDDQVYATGGGGCAIAPGSRLGGLELALGLVLGALMWRSRRRHLRVVALLLGGALLAALTSGCGVDPYCLNCQRGDAGDAGEPGDAADGGDEFDAGDGGADAGCIVGAPELCNDFDDDCDGLVDEAFDLQGDELNCGVCGMTCAKDGARTECLAGVCEIYECFPGFEDVNGDIDAPFDQSDGCEYACFESNGGVEACDNLDNDCNGTVDDPFAFASDEQNCGGCGVVCGFFHAETTCTAGVCSYNPLVDCDAGYNDANGSQADGCEYACTLTNGGAELCDFIDNDCDGAIDETVDQSMDPNNCGLCSRVCTFPHAIPGCSMGLCEFDPATDCLPGFHDADGIQLNGCEYACTVQNGGVELCNGVDDDCDGKADGVTTDSGAACNNAPSGTATGACTSSGTRTCVGATLRCVGAPEPSSETCNGADDDCDGSTDETPVDVGAVCSPAVGNCTAGIFACVTGTRMCLREIGPTPELCNGIDDDCDAQTDESPTDPGLGGACGTTTGACNPGTLACASGALVCAGQTAPTSEICNGIDDDCDGTIDVGAVDVGGPCGSDVGACVPGTQVCAGGLKVCSGGIVSGAESCNNTDDDCDGIVDDSVIQSCYTGPAGTQNVGACAGGSHTCTAGAFGACVGQVTPAGEACNNLDEDCDGTVDEGVTQGCYTGPASTQNVGRCVPGTQSCSAGAFTGPCTGEILPGSEGCNNLDDDCDGSVDESVTQGCYTGPAGTVTVGVCKAGNQACSAGAFAGPCVGQVTPGSEACNNLDDDCDTSIDEGVVEACYTGPVGTSGVGICSTGSRACSAGSFTGPCTGQVTPGGESCNNLDDDCDGSVDDSVTQGCYTGPAGTLSVGVCTGGNQNCSAGAFSGPCVGQVTPGGELCNNQDDDCDAAVDEGVVQSCYTGPAGTSGVGVCSTGAQACTAGAFGGACVGQVTPAGESCNSLDDDCDGTADDGVTQACYSGPNGTQNVGLCTGGLQVCSSGAFGGPCVGQITPAIEQCNNSDDDCDAAIDENVVQSCYTGPNGTQNVGVCQGGNRTCTAGVFSPTCSGQVLPGSESCNNLDDDCDASIDENVTQSCYTGPGGTQGVGACAGGTATCSAGTFGTCVGQTLPGVETCNGVNDDCDGQTDEGLTQACYTGAAGTNGVGVCQGGTQACVGGAFSGACTGQVVPAAESCNNFDDDCDGTVDETLVQACYTGAPGTQNVGTCVGGSQSCVGGAFGSCAGQVTPVVDRCGDGLNSDCDASGTDVLEGCLVAGAEVRLDGGGGGSSTTAGQFHSFDVQVASGGTPVGRNIYHVWSDRKNGASDVFFRRSNDGGASFSDVQNLTSGTGNPCVAPQIVAAADRVYVVYQEFNVGAANVRALRLARSIDSGATFSAAQDLDVTVNDNFNHDVATSADGTRVVIAWEQLNTTTLRRNVLSRASSNSGATLAAVRTVNVGSGAAPNAGRPSVAVTASNRFVFLWRERRAGATFDIFAAWSDSTSAAIPLADEDRLDGDGVTTPQVRDGNFPQLLAVGNNLYATWQDVSTATGGGADIMFARVVDGGTAANPTWSSEVILDDPLSEVSSSFAPTIDADPATAANNDDVVFVAWEDHREGAQVYLARSANAGASFSAAVRASNAAGAAVTGTLTVPKLVFAGSNLVVIAYQKTVAGVAHVFAASSIDGGITWHFTDPQIDAGAGPATGPVITRFSSATAPTIGASIAWIDFRTAPGINGDPRRVRYAR